MQEVCIKDSEGRVDVTGIRNADIKNQIRVMSEQKITHHAADKPRSTRGSVCHARLACLGSKLPHMSTPDPVAATSNVTER